MPYRCIKPLCDSMGCCMCNCAVPEEQVSPAKTNAERQRELRKRRAEEQAAEVRGIYAHLDDHEAIKEAAAKINRRRARLAAKRAAP